ncbi:hypothetical protein M378DRAFT_160546, partial [Amanita muscaria Koide BX008]
YRTKDERRVSLNLLSQNRLHLHGKNLPTNLASFKKTVRRQLGMIYYRLDLILLPLIPTYLHSEGHLQVVV